MASSLLCISFIYFLLIQYAQRRSMVKVSFIAQFFIGWLIIELAWMHIAISASLVLIALGDFNQWSFGTLLGIALTGFNIQQLLKIHRQGKNSAKELEQALQFSLGSNYKEQIHPDRLKTLDLFDQNRFIKPFSMKSEQIESIGAIQYGSGERQILDIFRPKKISDKPRPVMLQIHGGGWIIGDKREQGKPLRNQLVEAGWIFIAINYRLSPKNKFPDHLIDCKKALAWIKENISRYGGDPNFIMVTGGSAGGHLASLVALSANQEQDLLQPGFEGLDTSVQGAIPMYGVYDFADRHQHRTQFSMQGFLEKTVMPETLEANPKLWDLASPTALVNGKRPPFFVIHGELDTLSFVEDARYFVRQLKEDGSNETAAYAELKAAQHAFDIFYSPRCIAAVNAMHHFAEYVYSQYLFNQGKS